MERVYIDIRKENQWIRKYFNNKDFISVDDLLDVIENLDSEVECLKEQIEDIKQDRDDNYRPIPYSEQICVDENMFH